MATSHVDSNTPPITSLDGPVLNVGALKISQDNRVAVFGPKSLRVFSLDTPMYLRVSRPSATSIACYEADALASPNLAITSDVISSPYLILGGAWSPKGLLSCGSSLLTVLMSAGSDKHADCDTSASGSIPTGGCRTYVFTPGSTLSPPPNFPTPMPLPLPGSARLSIALDFGRLLNRSLRCLWLLHSPNTQSTSNPPSSIVSLPPFECLAPLSQPLSAGRLSGLLAISAVTWSPLLCLPHSLSPGHPSSFHVALHLLAHSSGHVSIWAIAPETLRTQSSSKGLPPSPVVALLGFVHVNDLIVSAFEQSSPSFLSPSSSSTSSSLVGSMNDGSPESHDSSKPDEQRLRTAVSLGSTPWEDLPSNQQAPHPSTMSSPASSSSTFQSPSSSPSSLPSSPFPSDWVRSRPWGTTLSLAIDPLDVVNYPSHLSDAKSSECNHTSSSCRSVSSPQLCTADRCRLYSYTRQPYNSQLPQNPTFGSSSSSSSSSSPTSPSSSSSTLGSPRCRIRFSIALSTGRVLITHINLVPDRVYQLLMDTVRRDTQVITHAKTVGMMDSEEALDHFTYLTPNVSTSSPSSVRNQLDAPAYLDDSSLLRCADMLSLAISSPSSDSSTPASTSTSTATSPSSSSSPSVPASLLPLVSGPITSVEWLILPKLPTDSPSSSSPSTSVLAVTISNSVLLFPFPSVLSSTPSYPSIPTPFSLHFPQVVRCTSLTFLPSSSLSTTPSPSSPFSSTFSTLLACDTAGFARIFDLTILLRSLCSSLADNFVSSSPSLPIPCPLPCIGVSLPRHRGRSVLSPTHSLHDSSLVVDNARYLPLFATTCSLSLRLISVATTEDVGLGLGSVPSRQVYVNNTERHASASDKVDKNLKSLCRIEVIPSPSAPCTQPIQQHRDHPLHSHQLTHSLPTSSLTSKNDTPSSPPSASLSLLGPMSPSFTLHSNPSTRSLNIASLLAASSPSAPMLLSYRDALPLFTSTLPSPASPLSSPSPSPSLPSPSSHALTCLLTAPIYITIPHYLITLGLVPPQSISNLSLTSEGVNCFFSLVHFFKSSVASLLSHTFSSLHCISLADTTPVPPRSFSHEAVRLSLANILASGFLTTTAATLTGHLWSHCPLGEHTDPTKPSNKSHARSSSKQQGDQAGDLEVRGLLNDLVVVALTAGVLEAIQADGFLLPITEREKSTDKINGTESTVFRHVAHAVAHLLTCQVEMATKLGHQDAAEQGGSHKERTSLKGERARLENNKESNTDRVGQHDNQIMLRIERLRMHLAVVHVAVRFCCSVLTGHEFALSHSALGRTSFTSITHNKGVNAYTAALLAWTPTIPALVTATPSSSTSTQPNGPSATPPSSSTSSSSSSFSSSSSSFSASSTSASTAPMSSPVQAATSISVCLAQHISSLLQLISLVDVLCAPLTQSSPSSPCVNTRALLHQWQSLWVASGLPSTSSSPPPPPYRISTDQPSPFLDLSQRESTLPLTKLLKSTPLLAWHKVAGVIESSRLRLSPSSESDDQSALSAPPRRTFCPCCMNDISGMIDACPFCLVEVQQL